MASGVQFRGKAAILKAFENINAECWGIFLKKTLNWKGTGSDDLSEYLQMLEDNGAGDVYTLKIFEEISEPKQIKENTPADYSLNFTLYGNSNAGYQDGSVTRYEAINTKNKLFERLESIEQKLGLIDAPKEEEEPTIEKTIIGIIEDPDKLLQYVNIGKLILGFPAQDTAPRYPAVLGNTNTMNQGEQNTISQEQRIKRLAAAIDILEANDSKIVEHLEKLALIAQDNPKKFQSLLNMLNVFG